MCPKCEHVYNCGCKNCNSKENTISMDDNHIYKCKKCLHEFNIDDSFEYEWDYMHRKFKENITIQICIDYLNGGEKGKKILDRFGKYGIESAISQHTGIRFNRNMSENVIIILTRLNKIRTIKKVNTSF
jgi:hypothetical protein